MSPSRVIQVIPLDSESIVGTLSELRIGIEKLMFNVFLSAMDRSGIQTIALDLKSIGGIFDVLRNRG